MPDPLNIGGNTVPRIVKAEHIGEDTGDNIGAKRVASYASGTDLNWQRTPLPLIDFPYDYVSVTYPSATSEVYAFKNGGSGGTTVRTITLVYTDSTKTNLSTATRT